MEYPQGSLGTCDVTPRINTDVVALADDQPRVHFHWRLERKRKSEGHTAEVQDV